MIFTLDSAITLILHLREDPTDFQQIKAHF